MTSPHRTHHRYARTVGIATFIVSLALSALLFALLDVNWIFLTGPAIGIAAAAYAAYRTAQTT